jgi:hypothetical protein
MLSRKLWRILHDHPSTNRIKKVLLPDYTPPDQGNYRYRTALMIIVWLGLCISFPFLIVALSITLFSLRFAWKTTTALTRQHELGRHETLAATPLGEIGSAWIIGSAYYVSVSSFASDALIFSMVVGTLVILVMSLAVLAAIPLGFFTMFALAYAIRFDYQQAMVASFLFSILANARDNTMNARWSVIGGFLMMQVASYVAFFFFTLFPLLITLRFVSEEWRQFVVVGIAVALGTAALFVVREIIIIALHHQIKISLTDDLFHT